MESIEDRLKELILTKYKSIREFTIVVDMPYSTMDSILKRGINNASIGTVLKICKELQISADSLAQGRIESNHADHPQTIAAHFDGDEYTEEELEEIKQFAEFVKSRKK